MNQNIDSGNLCRGVMIYCFCFVCFLPYGLLSFPPFKNLNTKFLKL